MYVSAPPRESRSSEICVGINRKPEKNIPDIIDRNLNISRLKKFLAEIFLTQLVIK